MPSVERLAVTTMDTSSPIATVEVTVTSISHRANEVQQSSNQITFSVEYINICPTRCNTKQSIYYSESSLYMFRVSTTPIIRSTQNCN